MRSPIGNELGRKAASWMATCFVVVGGLTACVVMAVLFFEEPLVPLSWIGGGMATVGALLWMLRDRSESSGDLGLLAWVLRGRDAGVSRSVVRVAKKREERPVEYGTNLPPSVEKIREAADGRKTWVPPDARSNRSRLDLHRAHA